MRPQLAVLLLAALSGWAVGRAVPLPAEPVAVFTDHPRLFLRPARLRLLEKERERASPRWQQFDSYMTAEAAMPESGFALALYYAVSKNAASGRKAIAWALGPGTDLRQLALIFDWCQPLLTPAEKRQLIMRIQTRMDETSADEAVAAVRSRALAAIALYDDVPELPNRELERVVRQWWEGKIAPALAAGRPLMPREDVYALWELLHAVRDNTNLDLRESCPRFFKSFAIEHLMSNYPASYRGADNDFRITASPKIGEPDLHQAALSRAADLATVAFDTNAEENQYLQGWLMHDNFALRDALGSPYEFLWANPYQPGLSFDLLPLVYHNADSGTIFVRSDWEESADWFGFFEGVAQWFHQGRLQALKLTTQDSIRMPSAVISFGARAFHGTLEEAQTSLVFVGLTPSRIYQVEIDDEEVMEKGADPGGVLVLDVLPGKETGVRLREIARKLPAAGAAAER